MSDFINALFTALGVNMVFVIVFALTAGALETTLPIFIACMATIGAVVGWRGSPWIGHSIVLVAVLAAAHFGGLLLTYLTAGFVVANGMAIVVSLVKAKLP